MYNSYWSAPNARRATEPGTVKQRSEEEQLVGVVTVLDMAIMPRALWQLNGCHRAAIPRATYGLQWLAVHIKDHHNLVLQLEIDPQANPTDEEARDLLFQAAARILAECHQAFGSVRRQTATSPPQGEVRLTVSDQGAGFVVKPDSSNETTFGLFHLKENASPLSVVNCTSLANPVKAHK